MGETRAGGEAAAGQLVAMLVAGTIFLASIAFVVWGAAEGGGDDGVAPAARKSEAEGLLDVLLGSEGSGWQAGVDSVGRIGLRGDDGGLSLDKMDALRGASYEANGTNGLLDYDETLASLGLEVQDGVGTQFHLRIYPIGLEDVLATSDLSHVRTAYIGDWTSLASVTVALDVDSMTMVRGANAGLNATIGVDTVNERQMLLDLGLGYNDRIHIAAGTPDVKVQVLPGVTAPITTLVALDLLKGDVYPDIKTYLNTVFASRIGEYDLLIVGSGVDHESLTSTVVKDAVRDWVLAGGDLMVFGSGAKNFQWLQPLFSVGTTSVNGQAFAPDVNHPMLQEPHALDWPHYDSKGIAWDIKSQGEDAHYEDFEHVVMEGGEDLLAVSLDGAFDDGRVFLTAFQPKTIAGELGFEEGRDFLHNMIVYSDRAYLYLDYGPAVPDDAAVAAAVRQTHVLDPDLGQVPVRVEILLWHA